MMRVALSCTLMGLVIASAGCRRPEAPKAAPAAATLKPGTREVVVHVQGMNERLNLF